MKLIITNATICDRQSAFNGKQCDVFISNGFIEDVKPASKKNQSTATKKIDANGAFLSPGFVDMRASLREPGYEFKEDLNSASQAAAAGGYTTITALPDTFPTLQHKADIEFILRRAENLPVHILPYAAVTKNREGMDMNELYDLHNAGAVAFSDGNKTIMHSGVMMRALLYSKIFGGLIISHAEDTNLSSGGRMHEGNTSVNLGLKGIPNMAEELMITRDLELARYAGAPVHIAHISSRGSVDLIRKAKKAGQEVSCDVAVANLVFTDENLEGFDSNFKLNPPLRGRTDRKALWDGIADGTIDCIVTDHAPEDAEHKNVEFEYASKGMIMLQTALSLLMMNKPENITTDRIVETLTANPRKVLKQEKVAVQKGMSAALCLFNANEKWTFNERSNLSKSNNSPVFGLSLTGRTIATINKDKLYKF
ncbi:MAG: dihydroorotase [Bacteroidota bacterium]